MKRILTVQDISCIGKCASTVALPILSAMGVETAVLPTAVLSAHTAFEGFTFHDLTGEMDPVLRHWKEQQVTFDAIYTGYLGSPKQVEIVRGMIRDFRDTTSLVLVDPAMGDWGRLYAGFAADFPKEMLRLCREADVIVPNITEACAMVGAEYCEEPHEEAYIRGLLQKLADKGIRRTVLTGVSFSPEQIGVMSYDREENVYSAYFQDRVPAVYHGTGDVFASCLTGGLVRGLSLEVAQELAVDYTVLSIRKTYEDPDARWYGVNFEEAIPRLIRWLDEKGRRESGQDW